MKERVGKEAKFLITALITVLVAGLVLVTILFCTKKLEKEMRSQLEQNLMDVANQNVIALQNHIHSNELLLEGLTSELMEDEDQTQSVMQYQNFVEKYGLKRLGYCRPDGMTVSTDGAEADLSQREFFKRGMEGKYTISGVLKDKMSEEHGNVTVMSMPMKDDSGDVQGVVCMTYDSDDFNEALQMQSFEGQGYSFAVNEDGEIMVSMGNEELELAQNFSEILEKRPENRDILQTLQEKIKNEENISGTMFLAKEECFYATPVPLMDGEVTWYMFTVVPKDYFNQRFATIRKELYRMDSLVILFIMVGVLFVVRIFGKQHKETMRLAYTDPLTGGANYAQFCLVVDGMRNRQGYLISMDVQNFSNINIAAGRAAGDSMIMSIWEVLKDAIGTNEMAARVREDQFALFMVESDEQKLLERTEAISDKIHALAKQIQVPGVYLHYGIYALRENESVEDGYVKAKTACDFVNGDRAKHYVFFREINHDELLEEQKLEEGFDEALAEREFEVWYQPKYSANGEQIVGSEALVRWRDKDGNLISPGRFIPLFEKNGMIARLDEYMFRSVCRQQVTWLRQGYQIMPVSVNLSRASLYYSDLVEKYENILKEYQLDARYIQIEVTESAMEGKADILKVLGRFREMGVHILMDDFGTGYSSLAILSMRCFDTLKLDKSLIDHIGEENGETLLYHVICMGQQLGLHITAEGVENTMQLKYLQKLNCDDIQGFLFARPMPASQFETLMST